MVCVLFLILVPYQAMETVLDVEETLIGSSSSVEVPLVNNSPCSLSFCLSVHQTLLDEDLEYDPETEPVGRFL